MTLRRVDTCVQFTDVHLGRFQSQRCFFKRQTRQCLMKSDIGVLHISIGYLCVLQSPQLLPSNLQSCLFLSCTLVRSGDQLAIAPYTHWTVLEYSGPSVRVLLQHLLIMCQYNLDCADAHQNLYAHHAKIIHALLPLLPGSLPVPYLGTGSRNRGSIGTSREDIVALFRVAPLLAMLQTQPVQGHQLQGHPPA
jgi:hypothetical protein